jgi:hypothetical protein
MDPEAKTMSACGSLNSAMSLMNENVRQIGAGLPAGNRNVRQVEHDPFDMIELEISSVAQVMDAKVAAEVEYRTTSVENTIEMKQDRVVKTFEAKTEIPLILARKVRVIIADFLSLRRGGFCFVEIVIDPAELAASMREGEIVVNVRDEPRDGAYTSPYL